MALQKFGVQLSWRRRNNDNNNEHFAYLEIFVPQPKKSKYWWSQKQKLIIPDIDAAIDRHNETAVAGELINVRTHDVHIFFMPLEKGQVWYRKAPTVDFESKRDGDLRGKLRGRN